MFLFSLYLSLINDFQSAVQQETIDLLYAETRLPLNSWVGPSWIDPTKWQHIMDLGKTIEKYYNFVIILAIILKASGSYSR